MDRRDILKTVNDLFKDTLDNPEILLKDETTANDVGDWDSLTHIQVVVAIEKHFKIRFTAREIQNWKNVGEMIHSIQDKIH
jgi:acyl carrier protein